MHKMEVFSDKSTVGPEGLCPIVLVFVQYQGQNYSPGTVPYLTNQTYTGSYTRN